MLSFVVTLSLAACSHAVFTGQDVKKDPEPKIHAKTSARIAAGTLIIRSSEQLGKLQSIDPDKASANLAKTLKVNAIDWKTQMVVVISGGSQPTGGYSVDVKSLEVKDGKLTVNWKLNRPGPETIVTQAFTMPSLAILVDRFEGEVLFNPKSAPSKIGKKRGADVN